jgi:DNA repair protein RadC
MKNSDDDKNVHNVEDAIKYFEDKWRNNSLSIISNDEVFRYLRLQLAGNETEALGVIFLTKKFNFIAFDKLLISSIADTPACNRAIVEKALEHNASMVILAHYHSSLDCKPSRHDIKMTRALQIIMSIIDIAVLDHIIISGNKAFSFVRNGVI